MCKKMQKEVKNYFPERKKNEPVLLIINFSFFTEGRKWERMLKSKNKYWELDHRWFSVKKLRKESGELENGAKICLKNNRRCWVLMKAYGNMETGYVNEGKFSNIFSLGGNLFLF